MEDEEALMALIAEGKARRATHSTDINAASSRSHAVLRVSICHPDPSHPDLVRARCGPPAPVMPRGRARQRPLGACGETGVVTRPL